MPYAQLSGVRLHYYERGHGPQTVVLVHGFQLSGRVWQLVQTALPEDRYRTIAPDLRGAGESETPPDEAAYSIGTFAADVHELATQLGLRDVVLVGHSMGGATVAQLAVDHPDLLKGLVLLDPTDPDGRQAASTEEAERAIADQLASRRAQSPAAGNPLGIGRSSGDAGGELRQQLAEDARTAPEQRLRGTLRSLYSLRLGDRVARLPMPVLLACGDADETIPLERMLQTWVKYPRGTGLQVWHGLGHSPNVQAPERVAALLQRFVEETIPARQRVAAATP